MVEESALTAFICHLVGNYLQPTFQLLYNVIYTVKRQTNKNAHPLSISWFSKWWAQSGLHKIKTKPLARLRITAQIEKDIRIWFKDYNRTLRKYNIKKQNIINFDEAGFRIGCPKGQEVIVLIEIKEV